MDIPENVTEIGSDAFFGLNSMMTMNMPGFTRADIEGNLKDWGLGVSTNYEKIMIWISCKDCQFIINDGHDDSSGS